MEPDSPILPSAAGSLPASSPSKKGVERRFEAEEDVLADRLAVGLSGLADQDRDAPVPARRLAFPHGIAGPERPPRRLGWSTHPNLRRCHGRHRKKGVAPATASGSSAAQPPRRPWSNHNPDNGMRSRRHAHRNRDFAHIGVCFTCAALARHLERVPSPADRLPKLNRSDRDEPDLLDDLPLVKHPFAGELSFAQIVRSINRAEIPDWRSCCGRVTYVIR